MNLVGEEVCVYRSYTIAISFNKKLVYLFIFKIDVSVTYLRSLSAAVCILVSFEVAIRIKLATILSFLSTRARLLE